jgi:D-cysteine desulfhydrase
MHRTEMEVITSLAFFLLTMNHSSPRPKHDYQNSIRSPREAEPYHPPVWASRNVLRHAPPHGRLRLANLPTPLYRLSTPPPVVVAESSNDNELLSSLSWYIKRDDCTSGLELGGNKIRKLEFLLADALANHCNAVITIGGEQSNHCRATAAAARMVGLEPHLILRKSSSRTSRPTAKDTEGTTTDTTIQSDDLGLTGNLLVDRMVGSTIYTCTVGEYARFGSNELIARVDQHVSHSMQRRPYRIPVGGSNGLGSWGYVEAVHEMLQQWQLLHQDQHQRGDTDKGNDGALWSGPDHVVVACGSGGTAAGLAVGLALAYHYHTASNTKDAAAATTPFTAPMVHAVGVCDYPDYFYRTIADIAQQMGLVVPDSSANNDSIDSIDQFLRKHLIVHQGKGRGYAQSTPQELDCVVQFAQRTGFMLDPVYTGKAWYNFLQWIQASPSTTSPERPRNGQSILFWHTGGGLGLFDKCPDLEPILYQSSSDNVWTRRHRLDVYGKGYGIDISRAEDS